MPKHILFILILAIVCPTPAWSLEKTKAMDFVRFADNGNGLVIDLPGLIVALRNGADPNWIDRENPGVESTLEHFVRMITLLSRDPQTDTIGLQAIKTLIAADAKLQPVDRSILYWPVSTGKADVVALLLNMGASSTAWPGEEIGVHYKPVEYATKEGHQAIVDLLVAHGATRPTEQEAVQLRFVRTAAFGTMDELNELLKKGATVNGKDRGGEVGLVNATGPYVLISECHAYAKVLYLLDAGANPNMSGAQGADTTRPLHQAVWSTSFLFNQQPGPTHLCSQSILSELLRRGANVSSQDSRGLTPLHIASERNNIFAAQLLLEAGAKVMPRDKAGKTPLDFAESGQMVKLLKSYGATER